MKGIAVIPARGGSKGIKDKNIIDLLGKPLIAYTIEPALRLKAEGFIQDVAVSTDSPQIAKVSSELGASIPYLRPSEIAGDKTKTPLAIIHMADFCESQGIEMESVLVLQPTSPLRTFENILEAVELYDGSDADSLISCYLDETMTDCIMYRKNGLKAVPLNPDHNKGVRRQEHERLYIRNGAIYITRVSYLRASGRVIAEEPLLYEMPKSRSVNIDTEEDLKLVRNIMSSTDVNRVRIKLRRK